MVRRAKPPIGDPVLPAASVGRPTKYVEAYDQEVKDFMGQGYSLTAFAGHIGVSRECIYEWERTIPSFSDAVKAARAKRVSALERDLLTAQGGPQVTSRIFALKNACPQEWRDKHEVEMTGKDGGPMQVENVSDLDLARRIALALERGSRSAKED